MSLLLKEGRVVDPGSSTDRVADLLVVRGRVAAIGEDASRLAGPAAETIDASGLVVGPGFIDLHSHLNTVAGQRVQAMDGVTTALDLEAGLAPVRRAYEKAAAEGRPINFGFSASWSAARAKTLLDWESDADPSFLSRILGEQAWQRTSTPRELVEWLGFLETELADGALGIGVLMGYAPHTDPREFVDLASVAAEAGVPVYSHVRELVEVDPATPIDGSTELVCAAAETGASMHHCHVNSTSRRHVDRVLDTLGTAREAGIPVTMESYPYGAGSTAVGAYFLAPEGLKSWGLAPSDVLMLDTQRRVEDAAELERLRETDPSAACVVEFLDEDLAGDRDLLLRSLAFPDTIVASDAAPLQFPDGAQDTHEWPLPAGTRTHPRSGSAFTKALRTMVRESGDWDWLEAFRRCSYLPARLLDHVAPSLASKGHLGIGADADILMLDPDAVSDTATYLDPVRSPVGIRHLLVNGEFVVRSGELQTDAFPGRPVRGSAA